jgi:hypothetical protein
MFIQGASTTDPADRDPGNQKLGEMGVIPYKYGGFCLFRETA